MTGEIRIAGVTGAPRFDWYDWRGGREAMLRFEPDNGPIVIAAPPLFEEANRTRAFTVAILRALAARGIGSVLPDIPGQGESLTPLGAVSLADMRAGFAAAAGQSARYVVALRSGALIDSDAVVRGRWSLGPQDGAALVRELRRIGLTESDEAVEFAGNRIAGSFLADLATAKFDERPGETRRIVRLTTDPLDADRKVAGAPLWRRSEPGNDPALAQLLADDIADWIARCEG